MRHLKKILGAISVAAIAGLGLAGCSSGGSSSSKGSSTVSFMTWESNATNAAIDKAMKKFTSDSGVTVKREKAPNSDYAQKLASLIMSKKAPDFFWCTTAEAQNLGSEGLLYDWSSKLNAGHGLTKSKFSPGSLKLWQSSGGKLYGIPTLANSYGFFYNASAFQKAGLAIPAAGWTWDDLFSDLQKLKQANPSTTPLITQWALLDSPQGVSAYSVANGGKAFLDDFTHPTRVRADATFRAGAKRFADAIAAKLMNGPDVDESSAMAAFGNGGIPLMFGGQWLEQTIAPNKPAFDWGYAPWPAGTKKSVQPIEANGVCSPASLKNPDDTWKTIAYLDSTGFNSVMKAQPIAPIAYEPGSKGYYAALEHGTATEKTIAATVKYELGSKDKFVTSFNGPWATKAADIVKTSWNPALDGKKALSTGIDSMVSGITKLTGK